MAPLAPYCQGIPHRTSMGPTDPTFLADPEDEFWRRYLESCRRLGIEPVSLERGRELAAEWATLFERPVTTPRRNAMPSWPM